MLTTEADAPIAASKTTASPWTARIGLAVVGVLLVSCFGLLIAASSASTVAL